MTEQQARHGALTITPDQQQWSDAQLAALRQLWNGRTPGPGDLVRFLNVCQRSGLDPFASQVYFIERGGKWSVQTAIDGFRVIRDRIAQQRGLAVGYDDTLYCGPDGGWTDAWLVNGPPAAAKVTVTVSSAAGVARFAQVALWREYGSDSSMWRKMPTTMLAKVAEAQALRRAFPHDLSGLYTSDEMAQSGVQPEAPQQRAEAAADTPDPAVAVQQHLQCIVGASTDDELRGCWEQLKQAGAEVATARVPVPDGWERYTDGDPTELVPLHALVKVAKARLDAAPDAPEAEGGSTGGQPEPWPDQPDAHPDDLPAGDEPVCGMDGCPKVATINGLWCGDHDPHAEASDPRAADRQKDTPRGRDAMAKARADLKARQAAKAGQ